MQTFILCVQCLHVSVYVCVCVCVVVHVFVDFALGGVALSSLFNTYCRELC